MQLISQIMFPGLLHKSLPQLSISLLSSHPIYNLTHSNSFTSSRSPGSLSKTWVKLCHVESPPYLFFSPRTPTLPFPSSIHPSPHWRGGMQGCIPGLMKLILLESRPKWSLDQHHKNKRLLVQEVSHTKITEAFRHICTKKENRNKSMKKRKQKN